VKGGSTLFADHTLRRKKNVSARLCSSGGRVAVLFVWGMAHLWRPAFIKTLGLVLGLSLLAGAFLGGCMGSGLTGDFLIAFVSKLEGQRGLFVMHSDGSAVRRLTSDTLLVIRPSAWSPDGRRILFFPFRPGPGPAQAAAGSVPRANLDMHVSPPVLIDADGQNERRLSDQRVVSDCSWSPDSTRVVCSSGAELPEGVALYVFDVGTRVRTRVTSGASVDMAPAWSADGKHIAFSSSRSRTRPFKRNIFVIDADGTHERQLTDGDDADVMPAWSPDGRSIAFVRSGFSGTNLFVVDAARPKPRMLPTAYGSQPPAWSRDGRQIMYVCPEGICLVDPRQGEAHVLVEGGHPVDAVLAPDATRVIYRSSDGPSWNIYAFDLRMHARVKLTNDGEDIMFAVSPLLPR